MSVNYKAKAGIKMLYLVDTANLDAIKKCCEFFPIDGVTTNPTIIAREKTDFQNLILAIREIIGPQKQLHVQTTATVAEDIVKEAKLIKGVVGDKFFIKIPITAEGLKATPMCKDCGIGVTMTAIFTHQQALISAKAGADFVAPYVNRLDNIVADGVQVVSDISHIFKEYNLNTKVLAASFKNVEQIHRVSLTGAGAVTISPELFDMLCYHPLTDAAIANFNRDWVGLYGDKTVSDLLK